MKNFTDWKNSVVGKPLLVLPSSIADNKGECFDVAVSWTDNLGIPHFPGNPSPFPYPLAYEIYTLFGSWQAQYFDRIANGLFNAPKEGDIVVLRPNHVVVATGNNSFFEFEAVSQNYGPNPDIVSVMQFPYNYFFSDAIYGWLHPKALDVPTYPHEDLARQAAQTALNEIVTASQQGDPNFKVNMADVKAKLQEAIGYL